MPSIASESQTATLEKFGWAGEDGGHLPLDAILPAIRSNRKAKGRASTFTPRDHEIEADASELTSVMTQLEIEPLIRITEGNVTIRRFKVLQQFECVVTELLEDAVVAELFDLTDQSRPNEIAEIPLSDIPSADHTLLSLGCVFYWILGFEMSVGGQRNRVSEIRVRRTPKWTENKIEAIKTKGEEFFKQFSGGSKNQTS